MMKRWIRPITLEDCILSNLHLLGQQVVNRGGLIMKRWIHAATDDDAGTFSWNGWFYTRRPDKRSQSGYRYLKSKNVRFDEFGNTEEVSFDEYTDAADKYYKMFGH